MEENFNYNIDFENRRSNRPIKEKKRFFAARRNKIILVDLVVISILAIALFILKPIIFDEIKFMDCKFSGEVRKSSDKVKALLTVDIDKFILESKDSLVIDLVVSYGNQEFSYKDILNSEEFVLNDYSYDKIFTFDMEDVDRVVFYLSCENFKKDFSLKVD